MVSRPNFPRESYKSILFIGIKLDIWPILHISPGSNVHDTQNDKRNTSTSLPKLLRTIRQDRYLQQLSLAPISFNSPSPLISCHVSPSRPSKVKPKSYTSKSAGPTSLAKDISSRRVPRRCNSPRLSCLRGPDPRNPGRNRTRTSRYIPRRLLDSRR